VAYLKTLPGIHPIRRQNDEENCEIWVLTAVLKITVFWDNTEYISI
jgi:hypothetical protein